MRNLVSAIVILLIPFWLSAQNPLEKRVDFGANHANLSTIINQLSEASGVNFTYAKAIIPRQKNVSFKSQLRTVGEVLDIILEDLPVSVKVVGDQVVLYRDNKALGSETKFTISGTISDAETGERLIGTHIFTPDFKGTSSNDDGFFSISLPADTILLTFSYIGYEPVTKVIFPRQSQTLDISLESAANLTEIIIIEPDHSGEASDLRATGSDLINEQTVTALPSMAGEVDIIKAFQLLPGVQSGNEGTAGLYIRGGSQDQNLILLDGVPIYYPSHMYGIFSTFNASTIKKAELIKDGFPARFGGRLSSILDITLKDGNNRKIGGEFGLGLTAANFMLEGPLIKDKTTFMVAGRQSYIDLYMRPITKAIKEADGREGVSKYNFSDFNAKLVHRFSPKDKLSFSFFTGKDSYKDNDSFEYFLDNPVNSSTEIKLKWSNLAWTAGWNHLFNDKLVLNTTLIYSRYRLNYDDYNRVLESPEDQLPVLHIALTNYQSEIRDWTGRLEFQLIPGPNHFIRFGGQLTSHKFQPGANYAYDYKATLGTTLDTTFNNIEINTTEFNLFFEDDIRLGQKAKLNAGVHTSGSVVEGKFNGSIQPRLALSYMLSERILAKMSFSTMTQYLHLLTNSGLGLPSDLWLPPIGNIKPQFSMQYVAGITTDLGRDWELTMEAYYKNLDNLVAFKNESRFFLTSENLDEAITMGTGRSYGAEILLSKKMRSTTGWLSYTLSRSERKFEDINNGETFPYKYDRTHDISLAIFHKFNKNIDISAVWIYGTGNTFTIPVREFPVGDFADNDQYPVILYEYEDRNNARFPAYHRLDLGINFRKSFKWGEQLVNFSIYNAYNRQNPLFVNIKVKRDDPLAREFTQTTIFPIIPSLRYNAKF
ncbi:MAG: TonB-dependent receptor [Bacteroidota bacterium]